MKFACWMFLIIISLCLIYKTSDANLNNALDKRREAAIDPRNYVEIGGHVYFIPENNLDLWMNVLEAMAFCKDLGMQLISLETTEENLLIKQYLTDIGSGPTTPYWTSGHKFMNTWVWMGVAEETKYSDWKTGEPNENTSDVCIQMFNDGWDDTYCWYGRLFICE